uniref:Uncharacterized protein n=1 Tax=Castor canadensis TaxID=51338 RepID=A0A8C0ZPZ4_CASCN
MGKRRSRSQSQLLSSLTKKQKKHLRDFGEEHPFYDRVSRKEAKPQICQLVMLYTFFIIVGLLPLRVFIMGGKGGDGGRGEK